jgi:hypothetical protein
MHIAPLKIHYQYARALQRKKTSSLPKNMATNLIYDLTIIC